MAKKTIIMIALLCFITILFTNKVWAEDYLIGAEDILKISVWETPTLDLQVSVLPDGKIAFPLVGDLQAAGLTISQLRDEITERLCKYIKEPIVTVLVSEVKSSKIYIQGEVNKPGIYILRKKTNILELLADAGGVTPSADLERVYLLRNNERTILDFHQLLEQGNTSQNLVLKPEDIIIIPNNFVNRITLVGEVKKPQILSYKVGLTVLDAVMMVDGFTDHADLNDVMVIRKKGDATEKINADMKAIIKKGAIEQNILLQPGDTVIVGESLL